MICLLLSLVILHPNCQTHSIVARVGSQAITFSELEHYLFSNVGDIEKYSTPALLKGELGKYVDARLKLADAYEMKVDRDESLLGRLRYYQDEVVYNSTLGKEVYDKAIPDSFLESKYRKLLKEFKIRHILVHADSNNLDELLTARTRLLTQRERILGGEKFAKIAKLFSEDSTTYWKGGEVGYIKFNDYDLGEMFYDALFALNPGIVSAPIRSNYGLHLVVIEDIRNTRLPPFKYLREQIRNSYIGANGREVVHYNGNLLERAKQAIKPRFRRKNLEFLLEKIWQIRRSDSLSQSGVIGRPLNDVLQVDDRRRELFRLGHRLFTIGNFLTKEGLQEPIRSSNLDEPKALQELLANGISENDYITQWGYHKGYDRQDDVKEVMARLKENEMITEIERIRVHNLIHKPAETEMMNYYRKHQGKYSAPARTKAQALLINDEDLAGEIIRLVRAGEDFSKLTDQYANTPDLTYRVLELSGDDRSAIGQRAVQMKLGEISELIQTNSSFAVIKVLDVTAGEPLEFNRVQSQIALDLRLAAVDSLRDLWLNKLKRQIKIQFYEDVLYRQGEKFIL